MDFEMKENDVMIVS